MYDIFLEVCGLLNQKSITPLLFGSLGLSKVTGNELNPQDIDILIPKQYVLDEWESFKTIIESVGFSLEDLHEHQFLRDGVKIAFADIEGLTPYAGINITDIKDVNDCGKKYLLLDLAQYLKVYKKSAVDGYRRNKNHSKDDSKIEMIEKLLSTTNFTNELQIEIKNKGANIVRFVDISNLSLSQSQGFSKAVVFCLALSRDFIIAMRDGKTIENDEFVEKEHEADALADWLAEYIQQKGYRAYSQSEENNWQNGNFDVETKSSKLPHKTIARLAGIGYIGKNNLLINEEYGCAFSMCTVLTDAPVLTESYPLVFTKCGSCYICKDVCPGNAILGNEWSENGGRDAVVDVFKCTCPLKCMVNCPKTLKYALQSDGTL